MDQTFQAAPVLGQTFSVFFRNILPFGFIATLIMLPVLGLQVRSFMLGPVDPGGPQGTELLLTLLSALLSPLVTAALTYGVFQAVRGKPRPVGACLRYGFARMFPVLGVSILSGIIVGVATLFLVIPGIVAATILAAAVPAVVIERPGVTGALGRSADLTRGARWGVFLVIFGIYAVGWIVTFGAGTLILVSPYLVLGSLLAISVLLPALNATASTLVYYHLRRTKEAIDIEEIAAVFE